MDDTDGRHACVRPISWYCEEEISSTSLHRLGFFGLLLFPFYNLFSMQITGHSVQFFSWHFRIT